MIKDITIKNITPTCARCIKSSYMQEKRENKSCDICLFCREYNRKVSANESCSQFKPSNVLVSYFGGALKGTHKRTIRDILQLRIENGTL